MNSEQPARDLDPSAKLFDFLYPHDEQTQEEQTRQESEQDRKVKAFLSGED